MKKKIIFLAASAVIMLSACTSTSQYDKDILQNTKPVDYNVVSRAKGSPAPTGFQPEKAEQSESSLNTNVAVVANRVINDESDMIKMGSVQPVGENDFSAWQLLCDEGGAKYEQSSPNPLSYMTTGIASNLMTQVMRGIEVLELEVDDVKVEAKAFFRFEDTMTKKWSGYTDRVIANIIIDSPESPEKIIELKELAMSSWQAGEGLANKTEVLPELIINGHHWDTQRATSGAVPNDISMDKGLKLSAKADQIEPETFERGEELSMGISSIIKPIVFAVIAVAQPADDPERPYMQRVRVRAIQENYTAWDLYVDDSMGYEGMDKAPTSLDYLTAGTGFCLMSQLTANVAVFRLDIDDYRVEQQINYREENYMTPDMAGYADTLVSKVIVKSGESEEDLYEFFSQSIRCCFAGEAFLNETEIDTELFLNGIVIE